MKTLDRSTPRALAAGILAVLALVTMTACGGSEARVGSSAGADAITTIRVGITGATAPPTFLPLIANKFGLDAQNHLKIELVTLSPNVTAQTLTQGSVDVLAAPSVETAILQGAKFKIIAGAAQRYWRFIASNGISGWNGLAGKKIALPCGQAATCHSFMVDLLKSEGVDANSVTFIYGSAQATYESLAAGSVDAALTTAPYTYALQSAGKTKSLDISKSEPYLSTQFTTTSAYISNHADVVSAFVKTMVEAEKKLSALPVDAKVLTAIGDFEKANGIDPGTLDQERFLTEFANDKSWQLTPTKALIQQDLNLLKAIPEMQGPAGRATFDQLVYQLPEFAGKYE